MWNLRFLYGFCLLGFLYLNYLKFLNLNGLFNVVKNFPSLCKRGALRALSLKNFLPNSKFGVLYTKLQCNWSCLVGNLQFLLNYIYLEWQILCVKFRILLCFSSRIGRSYKIYSYCPPLSYFCGFYYPSGT